MKNEKVKQTSPVSGDWYVVNFNEDRWFIERVILWLLMEETEHCVERIRACTDTGLPHVNEGDSWFVLGADKAPNGNTWAEIYEGITPTISLSREFSI